MEFDKLNIVEKVKCMLDYLTVVAPYDTEGNWDNATLDELETSIKCTLENKEFSIDDKGNWYYEGEVIR